MELMEWAVEALGAWVRAKGEEGVAVAEEEEVC